MKKQTTFAIFIAYNASKTLKNFYKTFPTEMFDKIILVDDDSADGTYELAKSLGIQSYRNEKNLGYGGNMKRALSIGLQLGGDIFVDIHPDGEYIPSCIPKALRKIDEGSQFVLGNRFSQGRMLLKRGMYFWKYVPILLLNWLSKWIFKTDIMDFHQGFRIYTRHMLEKVSFENNSNGYLFSFELVAQAIFNKIPLSQIPVETCYTGKKRGASLKHSIQYSLGTFKILLQFLLAKWGFKTDIFVDHHSNMEQRTKKLLEPQPLSIITD